MSDHAPISRPASALRGRQLAYALLAAAGLLATWWFNLRFMAEAGGTFSLARFVADGYATSASTSLVNDLTVGTLTFLVWSFAETRRLGMRHWWLWVVLTFAVAFAVAFPLFLLARERRFARA